MNHKTIKELIKCKLTNSIAISGLQGLKTNQGKIIARANIFMMNVIISN